MTLLTPILPLLRLLPPRAQEKMLELLVPRSPKWPALRNRFIKSQPWCRYCGARTHLAAHHVKPYHLFPKLELDPRNLITLCEGVKRCHLQRGHLGSWMKWNKHIRLVSRFPRPSP